MLFFHIESCKERNLVTTHDSDRSDIIQKDLRTSYGNFELDDQVFEDDLLCNNSNDTSILFDNEIYNPVVLGYDNHHPSRYKTDFENIYIEKDDDYHNFKLQSCISHYQTILMYRHNYCRVEHH